MSLFAFFLMSTGCSTTTLRLVEEEISRDGTQIHDDSGQKIEGYLLHDGTVEEFKGRVRVVETDSLYFWSKSSPIVTNEYDTEFPFEDSEPSKEKEPVIEKVFTIDLSTVKALDVYQSNPGGTVGLVLGLAGSYDQAPPRPFT